MRVVHLQKNAEKRKLYFSLAEKYAKEYKQKEKDDIIKARQARKHDNFYVPQAAKLALVIRIRGSVTPGVYMNVTRRNILFSWPHQDCQP